MKKSKIPDKAAPRTAIIKTMDDEFKYAGVYMSDSTNRRIPIVQSAHPLIGFRLIPDLA